MRVEEGLCVGKYGEGWGGMRRDIELAEQVSSLI